MCTLLWSWGAAFARLDEDGGGEMLLIKAGYAALNLVNLGLAMYKCNSIGLFPTTPSDWLEFLPHPRNAESAAAAFAL